MVRKEINVTVKEENFIQSGSEEVNHKISVQTNMKIGDYGHPGWQKPLDMPHYLDRLFCKGGIRLTVQQDAAL